MTFLHTAGCWPGRVQQRRVFQGCCLRISACRNTVDGWCVPCLALVTLLSTDMQKRSNRLLRPLSETKHVVDIRLILLLIVEIILLIMAA